MDLRLTDPLCHAITVDLKAVYEYVPTGESANASICAHVYRFERPVEAGLTVQDVLRAAFALKGGESSIMQARSLDALWEYKSFAGAWRSLYTFKGRNIQDKSLNELLNVLKRHGKEHVVGMLSRRTHVDLLLQGVDVQRPQEEACEPSPPESPPRKMKKERKSAQTRLPSSYSPPTTRGKAKRTANDGMHE